MKIYREGLEIHDVRIDESTVFSQKLMGEHEVEAIWISKEPIDVDLGDYIIVKGENLYINNPIRFTKINNFTYRYTATFEGEIYELYRKTLHDDFEMATFPYFGDPALYLQLIIDNMNSIDSGWTFNIDLPVVYEPIRLEFNEVSCRVALTNIMEAFELEFRLVGKEIVVRQDVGFVSTYEFEYGRKKGLYSLDRSNIDESGVVTRLYVYGGEKNLDYTYRSGKKRLVFVNEGVSYLQLNEEFYGIREGSVTFPDIFPQRTGEITAVVANNQVTDASIDFNINDYLMEGVVAQIVFKSGALSGYEFDIEKYDHATKTITFIPKTEANDEPIPDTGSFQPSIGDQYTLVNIRMPQTYIDAAEAKLLEAGQEYFPTVNTARVMYSLDADEKYIRSTGIDLSTGMQVTIKDAPLGINSLIRIYSLSFPIVNPANLTAEIADSIPYTPSERIRKEIAKQRNEIVEIDRSRIEGMREGAQRLRALRDYTFDVDGYFDKERIKPLSIETYMLSVGAKSQNFFLNQVEIEANYENDPNQIRVSAGKLIHYEIEIEGLGYIWEMDQNIVTGLDPAKAYYLYAKCNTGALMGTWVIIEDQIPTDSVTGFYHFSVGILYPLKDGATTRYFMFTKGMTYIVGDTITTGRITSFDGLNYFDVSAGKFNLGDEESGLDWDVTNEGALTIRGAIIASAIMADDGFIQNLRVNSLKTANSGKRMEILAYSDPGETIPVHNQKFYDTGGNLVLTIDTEVDSDFEGTPSAGIRIQNPDNSRTTLLTGRGILSNGGGYKAFSDASGQPETNASILGLLFDRNTDPNGISAGVIGVDGTTTGNSKSYGGFFSSLLTWALNLFARSVTANYTVSGIDVFISCYNTSGITVNLPANPREGRFLFIRRNNTADLIVNGNGRQILHPGIVNSVAMGADSGRGDLCICFFDGSYWTFNRVRL